MLLTQFQLENCSVLLWLFKLFGNDDTPVFASWYGNLPHNVSSPDLSH